MLKRLLAGLVSAAMMVEIVPTTVFAQTDTPALPTQDNNEISSVPVVVGEDISKREENVKHFRLSDGSFEAVVFSDAVHYKDENGQFQDIDNTLERHTRSNGEAYYTNKDNPMQVSLPANIHDQTAVEVKNQGHTLCFTLQKQQSVKAAVEQPAVLEAAVKAQAKKLQKAPKTETPAEQVKRENQEKMALKNRAAAVTYDDILPDMDVRYDIENTTLKESLILDDVPDTAAFAFQMQADTLNAALQQDKSVVFCDVETGEPVFTIAAPYMFDNEEHYSDAIKVSLRKAGDIWLYTLTPDASWLQSAVYPVTIDPTIETSQTNVTAVDVRASDPDKVNPSTQSMVYVGHPETYDAQSVAHKYESRAYVTVPMPKLSDSARVKQAQLVMTHTPTMSGNKNIQVNAHEVTESWSGSTITWNNQPDFNDTVVDYYIKNRSTSVGKDYFDITRLAEKWARGEANYGVMLEGLETTNFSLDCVGYYSSKTSQIANRPYMTIAYREVVGLNSDWTYTAVGDGHEATVEVNNNTGNPVVTVPIASSAGAKLPVDLSLIYSYPTTDGDAYGRCGMGASWRTNYHMEVKPVDDTGVSTTFPYFMIDEDNRKVYFHTVDGKLVDDLDLGYTLTVNSASTVARYQVEQGDRTLSFDEKGYLVKIEDEYGNTNILTYTNPPAGGTRVLTSITDGSGKTFAFSYADATYGGLNKITTPDGKTYTFDYTSSQLSKIVFPGSRTTSFSYFGAGYIEPLNVVTYADDTKVQLTYYNTHPSGAFVSDGRQYPVKTLSFGSDTLTTEQYTFAYQSRETKITDKAGNTVTYQFNDAGQAIGVVDQISGLGQFYEYGAPTDNKSVGDLIGSSPLVSSVNNLLDSPFGQIGGWTFTGTGSGTTTNDIQTGYTTPGAIKFVPSSTNTGTRWASTTVTNLPAGLYTATAYTTTAGATLTNGTADLYVEALNTSGTVQRTASAVGISSTPAGDWQQLAVTIEVKAGEKLRVNGGTKKARGTFWMTNFQLEKGEAPSRFNLLENTNFRYGISAWDTSAAPGISSGSVVVTGVPNSIRTISQTVSTRLAAGQTLTFGGWGKADSASLEQPNRQYNAAFRMGLAFLDADDNPLGEAVYVNFNPNVSDWQYRVGSATIPDGAAYIQFIYDYSHNVNTAYFKDGFVYNEGYDTALVDDEYDDEEEYDYTKDAQWSSSLLDANGNVTQSETFVGKPATSLTNNKTYYILNAESTDALYAGQVSNLSPSYTRPLESENKLYQWKLVQQSTGVYALQLVQPITLSGESAASTMALQLQNGSQSDGTPIQMAKYSATNNNQKFKILYNGNGTFSIYTYATGYAKCLDATRATDKPADKQAAYVRQYALGSGETQEDGTVDTTLTDGQKWIFIPYDGTTAANGFMRTKSTYSAEGLQLTSINERGKTETVTYTASGQIATQKNANGNTTTYTYNSSTDELTQVKLGNKYVGYTYDKGRLSTIKHNENKVTYQYQYDAAGRATGVKVGNGSSWRSLATNSYNTQNLLEKQTYGSSATVHYGYDSLGRVTGKWYNSNTSTGFTYAYNGSGQLALLKDAVNNTRTRYTYNKKGDLLSFLTTTGAGADGGSSLIGMTLRYDDTDRVLGNTLFIGGVKKAETGFRYGSSSNADENPDTVYGVTYNGTEKLTYTYDAFDRLTNRKLNTTTPYNVSYIYLAGADTNSTTNLLAGFTAGADAYTYDYDKNGNITNICLGDDDVQYFGYGYDNSLTSEWDARTGYTTYYGYDNGGNLTSKTVTNLYGTVETVSLTYGNTVWKDLLTSYNGQSITYDTIGNPLTYRDGMTFTWKNGRELATLSKDGVSTTYQYDGNSIRTKKTVGGVTTEYYLNGDTMMAEKKGSNLITYLFDENGDRYGFLYNSTPYYYVYNGQGDVIRLVNASGSVVAKYEYNAWGKMLAVTNASGTVQTSSTFIGNINPIRYRGYYYDAETGFYYLQSRYYDPETCRFINADDPVILVLPIGNLTSKGLFTYCGNEPVTSVDFAGYLTISKKQVQNFVNEILKLVSAIGYANRYSYPKLTTFLTSKWVFISSRLGSIPVVGLVLAGVVALVGVAIVATIAYAYVNKKGMSFGVNIKWKWGIPYPSPYFKWV